MKVLAADGSEIPIKESVDEEDSVNLRLNLEGNEDDDFDLLDEDFAEPSGDEGEEDTLDFDDEGADEEGNPFIKEVSEDYLDMLDFDDLESVNELDDDADDSFDDDIDDEF